MFQQRVALEFSEFYKTGAFVDFRVDVRNDNETATYYVHSVIMCAASTYFRKKILTNNDSVGERALSLEIEMRPKIFEAYLQLVYEGHVLINPDDVEEFQSALQNLELACLPPPASGNSNEIGNGNGNEASGSGTTKQKIKQENKTPMGNLSLDSLPEDRLRNLVVCDPGDKNKFHCGLCNKPFSRKSSTFDHIMYVHTQKRDYKCFHCDKMLATSSLRSMHIHNKHLTEHKARKLLQL